MTTYKSKYKGSQIDDAIGKALSVGDISLIGTLNKTDIVSAINEIINANLRNVIIPTYDAQNYILQFQTNGGQTLEVDLPIETLSANLDYDDVNKALLIKKEDGTVISVSVSDLVDVYRGSTGDHIQITIGANNVIQAQLLNGTIGDNELTTVILSKINSAYDHSKLTGNPHDTRCSFGAKWSKTGLNVSIPINSSYNLLQTLNLTTDLIHAGNIPISSYTMMNPGTANALLRLPDINKFVDYVITVRLIGNVGSSSDPMEFFVDLQRADGSLVDGKPIIKNIDNSLNRRGVNIETASYDSSDNYITNGVKFIVNNPSQGSRTITLTGYEIFIKGNM